MPLPHADPSVARARAHAEIDVREAAIDDAVRIAALTSELGYEANADMIADRLRHLVGRQNGRVWVAVVNGEVAGWVQAEASDVLEAGFRVEIVGLVVGGGFRRCGIGRRLVEWVEAWAGALGSNALVVRSNVRRTESHAFYPALGFSALKTQHVYRKTIKAPKNLAVQPMDPRGRPPPLA